MASKRLASIGTILHGDKTDAPRIAGAVTRTPPYSARIKRASVTVTYSIAYFVLWGGGTADTPDTESALVSAVNRDGRSGEAETSGRCGGIAAIGDAELGEDVRDVVHDRARADRKLVGNLAVGGVAGHESQDFELTRRQTEG
jgi:hypothetical protein